MKITRKTTVEQLKEALKLNVGAVKEADSGLFDQIAYADKAIKEGKKVTKADLADLVNEVIKCLGDKFVEPAEETKDESDEEVQVKSENSVKPKKRLAKKEKDPVDTTEDHVEDTAEDTEDTDEAEQSSETPVEEKVDDKSAKKNQKSAKKGTKKGSVVSVLENKETGDFNVTAFAEEFTDDDGVKYVKADNISSMEDLIKEGEDAENIMFAFYWNKKQLKKFGYINGLPTIPQPKEFPNDVDLATCMWVSEDNIVTYAISLYTEALYALTPDSFEELDGVRYLGDIEFQIYRRVAK